MTEPLIIDASAAMAVLRDEPLGGRVIEILARQVRMRGGISVPAHFWLEITNALVRRYRHSTADVLNRLQTLDAFSLDTVGLDRTLWLLALARAERHGLTTYDATYLALTEVLNGSLLTLDADLAAVAGSRAIRIGPNRLAETSVPYEVGEPDQVWADFGGYLAQLRREALAG